MIKKMEKGLLDIRYPCHINKDLWCARVSVCLAVRHASKSNTQKNLRQCYSAKGVCIRNIPEEDEVCVYVDDLVHGGEHVGYKQSLCGTNSEHRPHVLSFLKH